ncbi:hypothetical protein BS639_24310 [Rouxiella silvae]|uniref:JmjC domain-containing protein n=1 Tax=Rouxiella silvae TaxID=1646373 RepID=A0ABX3TTR7_9GAMM|nr:cupin domain-containing protein [Rouxiella silvae]ORJ18615.1 hypothetical protein BS639_24310 [Rouxiella silvae]
MTRTPAPPTLSSLLGADNYRDLLSHYSQKTLYRTRLAETAAGSILTLGDLQDILNTRRLSFPRCRLVQDGKPLNPAGYHEEGPTALGQRIVKIAPERVMEAVSSGVTLAIDFIEDLSAQVGHLAGAIATEFQERTGATAFFSTGSSKGFTTHWDNSETLIFQLSGKKKWNIWTPTFNSPVSDNKHELPPPSSPPSESLTLEENDFLYLPRGYWHAPEPCGSHSLHISFAFRPRNGIDFTKYLLQKLGTELKFREDIDKSISGMALQEYVDTLYETLEKIMTPENLISFLTESSHRKFISTPFCIEQMIDCGLKHETTHTDK